MPAKSKDAVILAWANLVRTGSALLSGVDKDLKGRGFPPVEWYDVLLELDRAPDGVLQQSEVQSRILLAQYNFVRLLDRLEREQLLERCPSAADGRSNVLRITVAGRALRRAMWPVYDAAIDARVGAHLTVEEAETLARLLAKLLPDRTPLTMRKRSRPKH